MFEPGPVLPLDSIDKRRKNENIQSFQSEHQPHHLENIPSAQLENTRWILTDTVEKEAKQSRYAPHRENSPRTVEGTDDWVPSPKTWQKEERLAGVSPAEPSSGVSEENWRRISQIAADNSDVSPWPRPGGPHLWAGDDGRAEDKCIDKNCINPLNSASAKTSHSAKSEFEGSGGPASSPEGLEVDPPENETRSEYRNNIAKSSSGERKRLKGNIWTNRVSRNIKENSQAPPASNQFPTPSSALLSSRKFSPSLLASRQKPSTNHTLQALTPKQETFYAKYDSTEGVTTAVVLGGFFVFVCLLVVYKTKLKPLWKERQAGRHDNTPATRGTRRHSQISSLSTAYTVKSLPGAMLYIPVENDYNTPVKLKRSLSDPEIYFPTAVRHSLIVAVNGILPHEKLSSSSSSPSRADVTPDTALTAGLHIDINVIQPTPNISPSHSLRSFSADSKDLEADISVGGDNEKFSGIPFLIVPPSPVRIRRVSFSDTSLDNEEQDDHVTCAGTEAPEINICEVDETQSAVRRSRCTRQSSLQAGGPDSPTTRRRRVMKSRQMTLPCNLSASMSYLQVPGQERGQARLSPVERRLRLPLGGIDGVTVRRRLAEQSSIESYYSFASEGDGDIFASSENVRRGRGVQRQTSFCIPDSNISEYSEFNEDFNSSISDLFRRGRLENQGTFSEQGSIRSLSIDQEEITYEVPGSREEENYLSVPAIRELSAAGDFPPDLPYDDFEGYMSSSCSISMSSDLESSHQITVPVFIEPAPPEIRLFGDVVQEGAGGEDIPRLVHQETLHTDSGLDTEEICPATPTGGRFSAGTGTESDNLRLVLVRDIGIQCSAESPNLNLHRRSKSAEVGDHLESSPSLTRCKGKFQSELLF